MTGGALTVFSVICQPIFGKIKETAKKRPALKLEELRNGEPLNLKNF